MYGLERCMYLCTCSYNMQYTGNGYPSPQNSRECLCERIFEICAHGGISEGSKTNGGCTAYNIWALLHGYTKHNMSNYLLLNSCPV